MDSPSPPIRERLLENVVFIELRRRGQGSVLYIQVPWARSAIVLTPYFLVAFMASRITISPEPCIQKCRSVAKARNLYVDVKDGQIRLAWTDDASTNEVEYIDSSL